MLFNVFKNKKILITGHTGFKGGWLTVWLNLLGARVAGIALDPDTEPSFFGALQLEKIIDHHINDITDYETTKKIVENFEPDFIFHLAAQAIVSKSYDNPLDTFKTNVIGTANILGIIDKLPKKCIAVIITSDKCYENKGWHWPYRENDSLGGKDPYSASKACAELVYKAFEHSFLKHQNYKKITATARAGNVVGGGDWSPHRVIPDAYKAMKSRTPLKLRNPYHTRPWQHVLEPLSGYLCLAAIMHHKPELNGNNFNFGPSQNMNESVGDLVNSLRKHWPDLEISEEKAQIKFEEAPLLQLSSELANKLLKWKSTLNFDETITLTAEWYSYYSQSTNSKNLFDFSENQIQLFTKIAKQRGITWAL